MGIQSFAGSSVSTEGIVTVKITSTATVSSLPVPLPAGTYQINTGYTGSMAVTLYDSSDNTVAFFSYAAQGMFSISSTATKIGIVCPSAAINGIVSIQKLSRGISSTAVPLTQWSTKSLSYTSPVWGASLQVVGSYVYLIGGNSDGTWDGINGNAAIQRWDMNPANSFTTVYNPGNTSINGTNYSCVIGTNIYFTRGNANTTAFYKYDTVANTVTTLASRSVVHALNGITASADGTKIYCFGAYSGTPDTAAEVYTVSSNTWARIADLPAGTWGTGSFRDATNSNRLYPYGLTGLNTRYRYNADSNTYTNLGGSDPDYYANVGNYSNSGNYWIQAGSTGGDPTSQFTAIKTDGTADAQYIYTPTAAALMRDSVISSMSNTNQGTSIAIGSTYTIVHTSSNSQVYYTPTAAFLGGFN